MMVKAVEASSRGIRWRMMPAGNNSPNVALFACEPITRLLLDRGRQNGGIMCGTFRALPPGQEAMTTAYLETSGANPRERRRSCH